MSYVVELGDTVVSIAERYCITIDDLLATNPAIMDDAGLLTVFVGDTLNVPVYDDSLACAKAATEALPGQVCLPGAAIPGSVDLTSLYPPNPDNVQVLNGELDGNGEDEIIYGVTEVVTPWETGIVHLGLLDFSPATSVWCLVFEAAVPEEGHPSSYADDYGMRPLVLVDFSPGPGMEIIWEPVLAGTASMAETYVFGWDGQQAKEVLSLGLWVTRAEGNTMVFLFPEYQVDDPMCCPSACTFVLYAWVGQGMEEIGRETGSCEWEPSGPQRRIGMSQHAVLQYRRSS